MAVLGKIPLTPSSRVNTLMDNDAKPVLLVVSLVVGAIAAAAVAWSHGSGVYVLLAFIAGSLGYLALGAAAVKLSEFLAIASGLSHREWSPTMRTAAACVWPFVLAIVLIVFLPLRVLNTLFRG